MEHREWTQGIALEKIALEKREFCNVFRLHVYSDRVGGEGGFLENTIRINLPKGPPLGFGEICVDFWDFERGAPEPPFLLLLMEKRVKCIYFMHDLKYS